MSRSFSLGSPRLLLGMLASLLVSLTWATASASATTVAANCPELQSKINAASSGETIVLSGLCSASYTLPSGIALSLEGAPGTLSGFDGGGVSGYLLRSEGSTETGAVTLNNLIFQNSAASSEGALFLHADGNLTLENDQFLNDASKFISPIEIGAGKAGCTSPDGSVLVGNSLFHGDTGGGLAVYIDCGLDQSTFAQDMFTNNTLQLAPGQSGGGGGLAIHDEDPTNLAHVTQNGNVFDANTVSANGPERYTGGGETLSGVDLTSTDDRFSQNSLPGTSGAHNFSWGAGLSIEDDNCQAAAPSSTLTDDVIAANTIADTGTDEAGEALGAGVYVGAACAEQNLSNHLSVLDSTVTENTVTPAGEGAVAGIDGHPTDRLSLENSILYGDSGGAELGGFTGEGGSLSAGYSDACSGTSPLAGTGNICANPLLADNGNSSSTDVHETASSPTIDTGSNALVPSGVSTDAFGGPRIQAGHIGCSGEVPKVVDMGADELQPSSEVVPPCAPLAIVKPIPGLTGFVSIKVSSKGVALKLSCKGTSAQICSGGAEITTAETLVGKSKKIVAVSTEVHHGKVPDKIPVKIAEAAFSFAGGTSTTVQLKLNKTGLALLKRFKAMPALVLGNEATATGPFLFVFHGVRFTEAKQHKKHKKPKKHKGHHSKRR